MAFRDVDIALLQQLIFPLVKEFTGVDISKASTGSVAVIRLAADAVGEAQELLLQICSALEDGVLSWEEIDGIIKEALDVPAAIKEIESKAGEVF